MALDNNQYDGHGDIAQFLEKFKEQTFAAASSADKGYSPREGSVPAKPAQYERSFEKLEKKIVELEERFEASATQNQMILSELARTREAMERQKDKDAFLEHLSRTIANLKASVENLSRAQQERFSYRAPDVQRSFDPVPPAFQAGDESHTAIYHYQANALHTGRPHAEREEKERIITSLRQKASQLKAVNSALDREIKKAQQEKMEALKKSAEQAKEILSLRDQLTAAEERFKSFDFEGRIISIKQEYQQKVSSLENQLQAMSDTCMKQVEEIESLKAENVKLHKAAAEKEEALARLEAKEKELVALKNEMAQLEEDNSKRAQKQLAVFSERLRALEGQRDGLAAELEQAQASLDAVRQEKELLEKNFKELVEKINNNDAVIEQLKHKIEVLGQQNEELTHHNETLSEHNAALQSANETLSREKAEMTAHTEHLAREKEALSSQAQQLAQESAQMAKRSEHLTREKEELASVTPDKVLSHPTWNMGSKITVDSATMVNKGFEKIEAAFLFHFPLEKVKAIICRESLVHALLAYTKDGRKEYLYEYSPCDMKVAIAYALSKGTLKAHRNNAEDEKAVHALSFSQIDPDFYPLFDLTVKTYRDYGNVGMILYNYVDTYAIDAFLKGEIGFLDIQEALKRVYDVLADVREELAIERLAEIEFRLSDRAKEIVEEIVDRKRRKP